MFLLFFILISLFQLFILFNFPFPLQFWILLTFNDKCNRPIISHINSHMLSKSPLKYSIFLAIQLLQSLKHKLVKTKSLLSRHSIVEIGFCSFQLMIKCELRNKKDLIIHIFCTFGPTFGAVIPQF